MTVNEKDQRQYKHMRVSKMECDLERVSLDALLSLCEVAASGQADIAALIAKFRAQRQRTKQLKEYRDQIFAEIRVSSAS